MWTIGFWKKTGELAVRSGAHAVVITLGGDYVNAWDVNWSTTAGVVVGAMVLSVATSLAFKRSGQDKTSPTLN